MTNVLPVVDASVKTTDPRITQVVVGVALLLVYGATLAPGITLWDAGEFNAAIGSLGIPHPPGTPLYILMARTWATTFSFLPQAVAVNLLSAVATAIACALLGGLLTRWTADRLAGIAAGISAGTMLAVWQNATETEIYALSMLLAVLMVVVGDRAGARDSLRLRALLAYLMGLAVAIQISALVAAPAAILLAASGPGASRPEARRLISLGGVLAFVIGFSVGSPLLASAGVAALVVAAVVKSAGARSRIEAVALVAAVAVGMSAIFFMLVRAAQDPFINQGNPATFDAMLGVVTRQQYPLPGIWPRQAPVWLQVLTLVQYADWQVASGLDHSVSASWWRTPWSMAALMLAVVGARWHWQQDPRSARGSAALLLLSSLGVVAVLNLRAGPSILDSVLPPGALHEPRERDYFFALAFATTGAWIGAGAVVVARRFLPSPRLVATSALAIAGLPLVLNWRAANRRPEGMLAATFGEALLASAPRNAVLLVAGDNDSYTTWFRQAVLGERRDVVPVTISLLAAEWYRDELARRHGLLDSETVAGWRGEEGTLRALITGAQRQGRPIAAALTVQHSLRSRLAPAWTLGGMAFIAGNDATPREDKVDINATRAIAELIARRRPEASAGRDPASAYVARVLRCPAAALRLGSASGGEPPNALLDSRCNFK